MEQIQATLDRAVDFHQKGDLERAAQGYNAVLEAVPGHYRAKTMRASLMIQSGFSADGVKELAQCIKENPDDYVAYNNIALGLFQLEKHDAALRQLDRALELKPDHPEALALAAKIKKQLGHGDAADIAWKVFSANPNNVAAKDIIIETLAEDYPISEALSYLKDRDVDPLTLGDIHKLELATLAREGHDGAHIDLDEAETLLNSCTDKEDLTFKLNELKLYLAKKDIPRCISVGKDVLRLKDELAESFGMGAEFHSTPVHGVHTKKRVISFSLWGDDQKYTFNAVFNAKRVSTVYPGWVARFYVDDSVPNDIKVALGDYGAEVVEVAKDDRVNLRLFWRFLAHDDPSVGYFICRDCDSIIEEREAVAVRDWLESGKPFHIMRDHPEHAELIMAGMWGGIGGTLGNMMDMAVRYYEGHSTQWRWVDQDFLRDVVWPTIKNRTCTHDSVFQFGLSATGFPADAPVIVGSHVGGYAPRQWKQRAE